MSSLLTYQMPAQQKSYAEKTDDWYIENIDVGITIAGGDIMKEKISKRRMKINYDMVDGIIDFSDIEQAFNPMGIKGVKFPAKIQNYPIEISKLNVLKGEESRRRFDWRIRSVNEDAVSQKEIDMQYQLYGLLANQITNDNYSQDIVSRELKELEKYQNYNYQDSSEVMGTRILEYFWHTQKLKSIFSDTFYDVLIAATEYITVNIIHGEPIAEREDPLNVSYMGIGDSRHVEDSDIIVIQGYVPIGKIIDLFWDVLDDNEIKKLEEGNLRNKYTSNIVFAGPIDIESETKDYSTSQLITVGGIDNWSYNGSYDNNGNILLSHVMWRSRRKIGQLKYLDRDGDQQQTIVDEYFPIEEYKSLGWTIDWKWINEWCHGYKIGNGDDAIYKRMETLPRIGSTFSNPSRCLPPIVGTIYAIGKGPAISLIDRIKPYKYLYNVYMRRTELASARNKGVLAELDLAEIPDGWDEELQMMYAEATGYLVKDSFKAANKGPAKGKLISTLKQRGNDVLNLNSSEIIRANLELARYVKLELGEVAGISPQREGQIDNRETYGGVERSVTQSSHITEEWFMVHDNTKLRTMELMLETAKEAWRNATGDNIKRLQYVDDGLITHMFEVDGRFLKESEYGYYISDGQNDAKLLQVIENMAHAGLQTDKLKFSDLFAIYRDTSISAMIRKIEDSEERTIQQQTDAQQRQLASQEKIQNTLQKIEIMKMQQEFEIEQNRIEADLQMKEMEINANLTIAELKENSPKEREKRLYDLEKQKLQIAQKRLEMQERSKQFYDKLNAMKENLQEQLKSNEKVAKSRSSRQTIKK